MNDDRPLHWTDLGLSQGIELGPFTLRYYALAYVLGILLGYWHFTKMAKAPGSPISPRQVDDLIIALTFGIIVGGRLGYATFYNPSLWSSWELFQPWQGGMSFHGGLIGVLVAMAWVTWRRKLNPLRVTDYIAVNVPIGMMLGRIANFINGELWGRPSDVSWAMVFPGAGDEPRHPSQLYEAALEGALLILVLFWLFWRTRARWRPGLLAGIFAIGVGGGRFIVEFYREPDAQLTEFAEATGLNMGQWLTIPLILAGAVLLVRAMIRPETTAADVVDEDESDEGSDGQKSARTSTTGTDTTGTGTTGTTGIIGTPGITDLGKPPRPPSTSD